MRRRARDEAALPFPSLVEGFRPCVLAGVDEAGLGPLLGPLVIGYAAFRLPEPDLDLWELLGGGVSRRPEPGVDGRIVVADSKVVFDRTRTGAARLERTALAFLRLARSEDGSAATLLADRPTQDEPGSGILGEVWAPRLPARLPVWAGEDELSRSVGRLQAELASVPAALLAAGSRAVPVRELNASLETTENKSHSHWELSSGVLRRLWEDHAVEGLDLEVDRHGGRMRYETLLRASFPEAGVEVLSERRDRSSYFLHEREGPRRMRVAFSERADAGCFAVALASCLAKYARELCMLAFNDYFGSLQPGLRPTAGYVTDARRWLDEAGPAITSSGISERDLLRAR